jgi:hypothetical protein
VSELAAQMLAFESQVDLRGGSLGSSANLAQRGSGGFSCGTGCSHGRGGRSPAFTWRLWHVGSSRRP